MPPMSKMATSVIKLSTDQGTHYNLKWGEYYGSMGLKEGGEENCLVFEAYLSYTLISD